jgi:transcriptional regulator with XRE-family HTH domain
MDPKGRRPPNTPRAADRPLPEVFASNLRRLRLQQQLSVAALAARCGFTIEFVDSIERGMASACGVDQIARIAVVLGVEPAELVNRDASR